MLLCVNAQVRRSNDCASLAVCTVLDMTLRAERTAVITSDQNRINQIVLANAASSSCEACAASEYICASLYFDSCWYTKRDSPYDDSCATGYLKRSSDKTANLRCIVLRALER
jgi:hypothetical protein